jgi:nucleotide-binding universal stress UspA family protein
MYDAILVPTDGSSGAKRAVNHGIDVAARDGAELHALFVVDTGGMGFAAIPGDVAETKERLRRRGEEVLDDVRERARERDVAVHTVVRAGVPHDEIAEYVAEHDVDLVVMGRHGYLDADSHLGSVTDRVLRDVDVPVQAV